MCAKKRDMFISQMWRYGYFADQIPPCFSSDAFANSCDKLVKSVGQSYMTSPVSLSIYKSKVSRRTVSVPNPYAFAHTVEKMRQYKKDILRFAKSTNSESPITFIRSYNGLNEKVINSGIARLRLHARSDYISNLRERIVAAMGHRYRLSLDVSNFYDSLYTHSIAWAICGKDAAKKMFSDKKSRTNDYRVADELDRSTRNQKSQETHGILTGPFTSRIVSEIVMAAIDKELRDAGYLFKRYVDDYKFYFRSEYKAHGAIVKVADILGKYNLAINQSKIEIEEYPFDLESQMKLKLETALSENGVYGALVEAGRLHLAGEKGAYKYALRMLENETISEKDIEVVLAMLFNIKLIDPKYGQFIIPYLQSNKDQFGAERLAELLNTELEKSLEDGYEQEILNLLYFQRVMEAEIEGKLLLEALDIDNDFIRIIALDLWVNGRSRVNRTPHVAGKNNKKAQVIETAMQGQSMDGEHWLLLFESDVHGLMAVSIDNGKTAPFFKEMKRLGISFYCP